jgi:hypothetical protein
MPLDRRCKECKLGISIPLKGETRQKIRAEMARLEEEEKKVRGEMSERNRPLEVAFISKPATLLSVPEARQAYNLLYQLTNFLIQDDKRYTGTARDCLFKLSLKCPLHLFNNFLLKNVWITWDSYRSLSRKESAVTAGPFAGVVRRNISKQKYSHFRRHSVHTSLSYKPW